MLTFTKPLDAWFRDVLSLMLSHDAIENMLVFAVIEAQTTHIGEKQLADFLDETFREYCKKATRSGARGWFYAWFDEMSGTLRCSFCEVENVAALPFRCKVSVVANATTIAALALSSPYAGGVPNEDLSPVEAWASADDEEEPKEFELMVFAKRIWALE